MSERGPVFDAGAERAAVGAAVLDAARVVSFARGVLKIGAEAFYDARLGQIFNAVEGVLESGRHVDLMTTGAELRRRFAGEDGDGLAALARDCVEEAVSPANGPGYLEIVRAGWLTRCLQRACTEVMGKCYEMPPPGEADAFVSWGAEQVAAVASPKEDGRSNAEELADLLVRWRDAKAYREGDDSKRPATGLSLPWGWMTEKLCGLEKGSMMVLGGRPSAGKTTMEDCIAEHVCRIEPEGAVLRWTMDSARRELLSRGVCRVAGVSLPKLKGGYARLDQLERVERATVEVGGFRQFFHEGSDLHGGMAWIRAMCLRMKVSLVTIDYVQQIQLRNERGFRADNENARLTIVSGALKELALSLDVPFLVLSQLSRGIEHDGREHGQLSDLRSSGAIEQDADKVVFVSVNQTKRRAMEEIDPDATKHKRPIKLEVLKHKNGEVGWAPFWMLPAYFKFVQAAAPELREVERKGKRVQVMDYWPDDDVGVILGGEGGEGGEGGQDRQQGLLPEPNRPQGLRPEPPPDTERACWNI